MLSQNYSMHVLEQQFLGHAGLSEQHIYFHAYVLLKRVIFPLSSGFLALLALAIYTGVTVTFFGKRFVDWRFSWSYIIGWVAIILAFAAGIKKKPFVSSLHCFYFFVVTLTLSCLIIL